MWYFYRWLGYLGLLLFDVLICLLVLFGLIRNSRSTLIGYDAPLHPDQSRQFWTSFLLLRLNLGVLLVL